MWPPGRSGQRLLPSAISRGNLWSLTRGGEVTTGRLCLQVHALQARLGFRVPLYLSVTLLTFLWCGAGKQTIENHRVHWAVVLVTSGAMKVRNSIPKKDPRMLQTCSVNHPPPPRGNLGRLVQIPHCYYLGTYRGSFLGTVSPNYLSFLKCDWARGVGAKVQGS